MADSADARDTETHDADTHDTDEWTVARHVEAGTPQTVGLYRQVEELLLSLDGVTVSVSKTTVTFKGPRRGFAGARPTRSGVVGYFDLTRELAPDPRIRGIAPYTKTLHVHRYHLADESDLDETFRGWLREAHQVGHGAHLER